MPYLELLQPEVQQFINQNLDTDTNKLALQKNPFAGIPWIKIIEQIAAKNKTKNKLNTWYSQQNIIYPSTLSIEQTSSEITAKYKASIVSGNSLIDLTGGFGVDCYYFSQTVKQVFHCELDPYLSSIVLHNYGVFKKDTITCIAGDSMDSLKKINQKIDWIYIDPSRRNNTKGKVFMLADCLPNVPQNLNTYFEYSNFILVKTAPILDITAGLKELSFVKKIHIVAVNNEVKELLWEIEKNYTGCVSIKSINFNKTQTDIFCSDLQPITATINYSLPKQYLYEPNSAILKSGAFIAVGIQYNLSKLHLHSHLYTSNKKIPFAGRVFVINNCFVYGKLQMKKYLQNTTANITTRNFTETVDSIRKKWKIKEGGQTYVFFTTNLENQKIVLVCTKA